MFVYVHNGIFCTVFQKGKMGNHFAYMRQHKQYFLSEGRK